MSSRARVLAGDNVLIDGFIITGTQTKNVAVRSIGPSLTNNGVPNALQDPVLGLFDGDVAVKTNDDWKTDDSTGISQQAAVEATGLAGRHSPQPDARADTLALLRPAALAQMARSQPFRGIAEFPDEPQDKAPDRQNDDLPRHKKQEDHPGRLMHDAAPCCR